MPLISTAIAVSLLSPIDTNGTDWTQSWAGWKNASGR